MATTPIQRRNQEALSQPAQTPINSREFIQQRVDSIEFLSEEGPCGRCAASLNSLLVSSVSFLLWARDLFLFATTPRPAPVRVEEVTAASNELSVADFVQRCHHDAPYLTRNFPGLPQEFKDYVYANLSSKDSALMTWKRREGMTDNNAIFSELLRTGYIQDWDSLYEIFLQYQRAHR